MVMAVAAAGDCEAISGGVVGQPVNAVSSISLVVVGAWLAWRWARPTHRWRRVTVGVTLVVSGLGSIAFHATPEVGAAVFLHDLGLVAVPVALAATAGPEPGRRVAIGLVTGALAAAGAVLLLVPGASNVLLAATVVAAVLAEVRAWRTGSRPRSGPARMACGGAVAIAALAVVVNVLGRTGGPWCDPDSLLQGHAAWHVLVAVAVGTWVVAVHGPDAPG